jgi:hypothetical protein
MYLVCGTDCCYVLLLLLAESSGLSHALEQHGYTLVNKVTKHYKVCRNTDAI